MSLTVGSLFAGIGGFDLAARWMGWRTIWVSEIDSYASAVLAKHFPEAPNLGDITKIDWSVVETPNILCGGFPCQDISVAGRAAGIGGKRSGLWKEYARAIRELRPRYVVVENVRALLVRGLDVVLGDLAEIGYDAEWEVLSAADVGAPHLRERLWIVAYPRREGIHEQRIVAETQRSRGGRAGVFADGVSCATVEEGSHLADAHSRCRNEPERKVRSGRNLARVSGEMAHPNGGRCEQREQGERTVSVANAEGSGVGDSERSGFHRKSRRGTRPLVADGYLGARWWSVEPDVGRVAHGVSDRVGKLRGLGNAIVPQCAVEGPFRRIQALEAQR